MRMPNARDMSDEQQDIFEDAPLDGRVLVTGPPGTGKTVIAFLRAMLLAKKNKKVDVIMYNRVLKRFAQNVGAHSPNVSCRTFHSWFYNWWRNLQIENQDEENAELIYLTTPFERRSEVKEKGARWDNNARSWTATQAVVNRAPEVFAPWLPDPRDGTPINRVNKATYDAPEIRKFKPDWDRLIDLYTDAEQEKQKGWGHLIIDEGQDFCNDTYKFLKYASRVSASDSAITVLADDNQRLGEENSTTTQIADLLNIGEDRKFTLSRNFRNTRPIALLARKFYTGLPSGTPDLPDKKGNKPRLVCDANVQQQVEYIARYLRLRGNHEVGVVLPDNKLREQFFSLLTGMLTNYTVQTYDSNDRSTSERLIFDRQGVVTVLNRQSCKGLEFDVVFPPCLQDYEAEDTDSDTFKMNMYVMCSRARNELIMMSETPAKSDAGAMKYLPVNEPELLELISSREQLMQTPTFIIMPSRAFKRVSLVYDLLTPDLLVSVNGQTCFSEQQLKKVRLTRSLLVIQLSAPAVENAALSISLAEKIFATSEGVINKLTSTPLSNYAFGEFTFGVLPEELLQGETETDEPADTKPGEILRQTDAVRGFLFHAALKGSAEKFSSQLTGSSINPLEALADVYFSRYGNTDLLCDLISLCIKYDKEAGWNAADIITELSQLHPESGNYIASAFASLESGATDIPDFSDGEYLVEKAFLLLLLNPDENALRAIKQDTTLETGTLVTELAQKLAIFRYGYSRLDHQDRLRPGPDAVNSLRDIAAEIYNRLSGFVPASLPQHVEEKSESNDQQMSLGITGEPLIQFFIAETSDEHKYYKVRGLNLKKGFSGELVLGKTNSAYLVLINDIAGDGSKKFSPSLAKAAISNQHRLPAGSRFEVIDNSFVLKFTYSADAKPDEILGILSADVFPVTNALNLHLKKCKYYMEV